MSGHATVGGERAGFESYYSVKACHSGGERGLALSHTTVLRHATVGGREGWL